MKSLRGLGALLTAPGRFRDEFVRSGDDVTAVTVIRLSVLPFTIWALGFSVSQVIAVATYNNENFLGIGSVGAMIFMLLLAGASIAAIPLFTKGARWCFRFVAWFLGLLLALWGRPTSQTEKAVLFRATAYCGGLLNIAACIPTIGLTVMKFDRMAPNGNKLAGLNGPWSPLMQPFTPLQPMLNLIFQPQQQLRGEIWWSWSPALLLLAFGHLVVVAFIFLLSWHLAALLKMTWWRPLATLASACLAFGCFGIVLKWLF
jgi:hypothetical protein